MNLIQYSNDISNYLSKDNVIDFDNKLIMELSDKLFNKAYDEIDYIRLAYEYVRDNISHSADINNDIITCSASEAL